MHFNLLCGHIGPILEPDSLTQGPWIFFSILIEGFMGIIGVKKNIFEFLNLFFCIFGPASGAPGAVEAWISQFRFL